MELRFKISAEQCRALAQQAAAARLARHLSRQEAIQARIDGLVRRWVSPVLLVVPLVLGTLVAIVSSSPEHWIAWVIVAAIYCLVWRYGGKSLVNLIERARNALRGKVAQATMPAIEGVVARSAHRTMGRLEGIHRWSLSPTGLSMQGPSGTSSVIEWQDVIRLHDAGEFYQLFTRRTTRFGLAYYLAKRSTEMDAQAYDAGLHTLLERASTQGS